MFDSRARVAAFTQTGEKFAGFGQFPVPDPFRFAPFLSGEEDMKYRRVLSSFGLVIWGKSWVKKEPGTPVRRRSRSLFGPFVLSKPTNLLGIVYLESLFHLLAITTAVLIFPAGLQVASPKANQARFHILRKARQPVSVRGRNEFASANRVVLWWK